LIGVTAVAYFVFDPLSKGQLTWASAAAKLFLSVGLVVLAAYAASQADKLRDIEREDRKLALELEALGPYLAPLDKTDQDKFRVELGNRSFGQRRNDDSKTERSPASVLDLLLKSKDRKELNDLITSIIKAARG
jgi:hypothetical protein